jgi:hypothetical protein
MQKNRPPEDKLMPLSEQAYQRKKKNTADYNKKQTTLITIRLNNDSDADILSYLNSIPNKQGLIKALLRTRMDDEGFTYGTEAVD